MPDDSAPLANTTASEAAPAAVAQAVAAIVPPEPDEALESLPPLARDPAFLGMTATQFLGAFNDNIFKQYVLLVAISFAQQQVASSGDLYQTIAQGCFALPFILFSGLGGYLADRFAKKTIVVACKVAELVVMTLGMVVFLMYEPGTWTYLLGLYGVLTVMGTQSAFFGPAKYGILPEMLRDRDLPTANGLIQMTTFLSIIFGTALAGVIAQNFSGAIWMMGAVCMSIAVVGTASSLFVRSVPASRPDLKFSLSFLFVSRETWQMLKADSVLMKVLLASSLFWLAGGVVLPNVNALGKLHFRLQNDSLVSFLAAAMGIGIMIGCVYAGLKSKDRVRFGIARTGSTGLVISFTLLAIVSGVVTNVDLAYYICFALLIAVGFFAGLFAVPLQVFLQARPPAGQKGRMIATMNLFNWIGILLAAPLYLICSKLEAIQNIGQSYPVYTFGVLAGVILPLAIFFRPADELLS